MKPKPQILKLQKPKCDGVRGTWKENNRKGKKKKKNPTSLSYAYACLNSNSHFLHQLFWLHTPFCDAAFGKKEPTLLWDQHHHYHRRKKKNLMSLSCSLSFSRSLSSVDFCKTPILVTLDLKTLVTTSAENDGNNLLSLSLWIDPEFEIGFLGLAILWKP